MFAGHCHVDGPTAQNYQGRVVCSDGERIPGALDETTPRVRTLGDLIAVDRRAQQMSLEREAPPDRSETGEKRPGALGVANSAQARLTLTRWLTAIFGRIIHVGYKP